MSYREKAVIQGTMPGARMRRRPRTACMDGQHQDVDRTLRGRVNNRITEDRDKWRKYVYGVANPRIEDG